MATSVNTGPEQVSTTTILLVLATVFVALRFWARHNVAARYGIDDALVVAGLIFVFMIGGLNYGMVAHGMGRHASTLSLDELSIVLKHLLAFECLYVTAVSAVKLSILAMYLRIFPSREFKIGAWVIGSTVIAWWISIVLVCIFQCNPIYVAWVPWDEGTCINLRASFIGNAVPNILTDVAILIMPINQVWHLHATTAQKVSLLGTFGLGSFVLVASIYRFYTIMAFDQNDTTYTLAIPCTWCVVESACGVICACLPTLRPLAKMVSSRFGSSQQSKIKSSSRGPTELITIGGTGTHNPSRSKSPFQRLDDETGKSHGDEAIVHARSQVHTASTEYASSGDSDVIDSGRQHTRTTSNRGFV